MASGVIEAATNTTSNFAQLVPDQFTNFVQSITGLLQVLVGGMFGLVIISIFLRLWEDARMARLLRQLNNNIAELNMHLRKSDQLIHLKSPVKVKKK